MLLLYKKIASYMYLALCLLTVMSFNIFMIPCNFLSQYNKQSLMFKVCFCFIEILAGVPGVARVNKVSH